ncbi:hypothetical protein C8Q79DRAFT_1012778 [Trametes meyenii]|nr:hypothetical protein C8Q79DRAFT_1012778 [Trametes meyenii]
MTKDDFFSMIKGGNWQRVGSDQLDEGAALESEATAMNKLRVAAAHYPKYPGQHEDEDFYQLCFHSYSKLAARALFNALELPRKGITTPKLKKQYESLENLQKMCELNWRLRRLLWEETTFESFDHVRKLAIWYEGYRESYGGEIEWYNPDDPRFANPQLDVELKDPYQGKCFTDDLPDELEIPKKEV